MSVAPAATDAGPPITEATPTAVPAVVAVVVARDPGPWFAETLGSLAAQDYPNLSVLVIDAGSAEPVVERVAEILPEAFIHRLNGSPGFSAAANRALDLVSGASFLLFCHDDVALDARCLSVLVEEAYRSNAAVCGPKLVQWDDPERLLQLGMATDRFGMLVDQVDRGELDQEQYDAVRDVFVIPGAVQLIRADLFEAIGGFDPGIPLLGEDLDLCWRSHVAGGRVVVVPDAVARHQEALGERRPVDDRRRLQSRHRLRTLLIHSSRWSLLRLVPLALLLLVVEGLYALMAGRRRQAREVFGAIAWNLSRLGDVRSRRRAVAELRRVPDHEVHALQLPGSARFAAFFRSQVGSERLGGLVGALRDSVNEVRSVRSRRHGAALAVVVAALLAVGSRHLLLDGVEPVGQVPGLPEGTTALVEEWLGGWRSAGLGGATAPPPAFALLGALQVLFWWSPGLLQALLVVGPLALGAFGAWRMVRPFGSARACGVSALLYGASPLVPATLGSARWDDLVLYAGAPFLVGSLLRLRGASPHGERYGARGPGVADRSAAVRLVRVVVLVALLAAFVPAVVPVAAGMALAVALGGILAGRPSGTGLLLATPPAVAVGALALHLPWGLDLLRDPSWSWLAGAGADDGPAAPVLDALGFGDGGAGSLLPAAGLVAAAAVALVVGRSSRYDGAVVGWSIALAGWAVLWVERRGVWPGPVPSSGVVLAPVLAGLCLAAGLGVAAVEADLRPRRLPWRQTWAAVVGVGVLVAAAGGVVHAVDGRWDYPRRGFTGTTELVADRLPAPSGRVLWLGRPQVLPVDGWPLDDEVSYAVTRTGRPDARDRWRPADAGITGTLAEHLRLAAAGDTVRLGRLLAVYGIEVVIVVDQLAPTPYRGPVLDAGDYGAALPGQLDLERLAGAPDLAIYRNTASLGSAVGLPAALLARTGRDEPHELLDVSFEGAARLDVEPAGAGRWRGEVPAGPAVLLAVADDGRWQVDGARSAAASGFGGLLVVEPGPAGRIEVHHPTAGSRRLLLVGQLALVVLGVAIAQWRREDLPVAP